MATPNAPTHQLVSIAALLFQLALGILYVGLAVLIVPGPWFYGFWVAWVVGVLLVATLALRREPTRAVLVPVLFAGGFFIVTWLGERLLGWGA